MTLKELTQPGWKPGTMRVDITELAKTPHLVMLDLEPEEPEIIIESQIPPTIVKLKDSGITEAQLLEFFTSNRPHRPAFYPWEVLNAFTDQEKALVIQNAPALAMRVMTAVLPIPWAEVEAGVLKLKDAGLITPDRYDEILYT